MYHTKRRWKTKRKVRRKRQTGGFLNRYDFAYAGRDVVNQAAKVTPGVIKGATKEIDNNWFMWFTVIRRVFVVKTQYS